MAEPAGEHPRAGELVSATGVVAIGRNEGERLRACLDSIPAGVAGVVYVDSGSTDGSVEMAAARGVEVVQLDMSVPFTAARARNAGVRRLQHGFRRAVNRRGRGHPASIGAAAERLGVVPREADVVPFPDIVPRPVVVRTGLHEPTV